MELSCRKNWLRYMIVYICALIFIEIIMKKGTVKFFNKTKGFGFIKDDEDQKEYFVHVTGLVDEVNDKDVVTFELKEGRKGLNAVNVTLA